MGTSERNPRHEQSEREVYFFAYSATLRIFGDRLDLDEISTVLGLQPTHTHRSAETSRSGSPYSHDMWSYDPPVEKSAPLEKHIDALWAVLKPHKKYLLGLQRLATMDVFLGLQVGLPNGRN